MLSGLILLGLLKVLNSSNRAVGRQRFETLKVKQAAVNFVRSCLGNDVDYAACRATKLRTGSRRNDLKLLHCVEGVELDQTAKDKVFLQGI